MEDRTATYIEGRFADRYESAPPSAPEDGGNREWGYIPFTTGGKPPMIRHRSGFDMQPLGETLAAKAPRHVYRSAALYDDPAAESMNEKGWRGADLVFDLDADHLDGVDPAEETLAEMLDRCREETLKLLDVLVCDLGFSDPVTAFSGRRGYHVHVQAERVRSFEKAERREIVEYVTGTDIAAEEVIDETRVDAEYGQQSATKRRRLDLDGGWARRLWSGFFTWMRTGSATGALRVSPRDASAGNARTRPPVDTGIGDEEAAADRLSDLDGIGEQRAAAVIERVRMWNDGEEGMAPSDGDGRDSDAMIAHPAVYTAFTSFVDAHGESVGAAIDEPVTTDARRLMRLPGSLHGGSGLLVREIDPGDLHEFEPLIDAVPEEFRGSDVAVTLDKPRRTTVGSETRELGAGTHVLPEHVGIRLMAGGDAELDEE